MTRVSVIVPVFAMRAEFAACLDALSLQEWPRVDLEVIVVDNGGGADLAPLVARHPIARLVREPRPGSFAARNAGLAHASGDVLAFTDADCIPRPDWIVRGVAALAAPDATGVVAGGIQLVAPRPPGVGRLAYAYNRVFALHPNGFARAGGFGATANLLVARRVLDAVGPFDAALFSGGDMQWGQRAKALGIRTRYVGDALVEHQARPTLRSIVARERRLAGGNMMLRMRRQPSGCLRIARDVLDIELRRAARRTLADLRSPHTVATPIERVALAGVVALVQVARAAERFRILFGGAPRRA